ncbi:MAG TPA: hypothetical protein VNW47_14820 [Terriglobales bacterium]|jgi:hypothetical protein|nr:hypothetical protein [Terriglobales bacterium]
MKKYTILCLVLAMAVVFVPASQATQCVFFNNFCDRIQTNNVSMHHQTGIWTVGLWDYTCSGSGILISGKVSTGSTKLNTFIAALGEQEQWSLKGSTGLGDLDSTVDGVTAFFIQTNQPYTIAAGACSPFGPDTRKPSAQGR